MSDTFDPSKHLMELRGKGGTSEYMPVKWRIVWLRHDHPDAIIETECVFREEREAGFRARVTLPGGGSATGWGSETAGDFKDYYEKAETKALGRALAALGYGTQFVGNELDEGERIVESPVNRKRGRREEMDEDNDPEAQRFDAADQPANQPARQRAASVASLSASPTDLRPAAAPSAAAGSPPNLAAVHEAMETQADRQTPEGAVAWLMAAQTKEDADEARKRCKDLEIDPREFGPIYNDVTTRLKRTA